MPLVALDLLSTDAVDCYAALAAPCHAQPAPSTQFAVSAVKTEPHSEHLSLAQNGDAQHEQAKLDECSIMRIASDGKI